MKPTLSSSSIYSCSDQIRYDVMSQKELFLEEAVIPSKSGAKSHLKNPEFYDDLYQAYTNATSPLSPDVLLGSASIRMDRDLLQGFGSLSVEPEYSVESAFDIFDKQKTSKSKSKKLAARHVTHGGIIADKNWHVLLNDAFMLGGIHAQKDFHLTGVCNITADSVLSKDILWDSEKNRFRVLAREIAILAACDYSPVLYSIDGKHSISFLPPSKQTILNFAQVRKEISTQTVDSINDYLKTSIKIKPYRSNS